VVGYIPRWFTCQQTVTYPIPSNNRAGPDVEQLCWSRPTC